MFFYTSFFLDLFFVYLLFVGVVVFSLWPLCPFFFFLNHSWKFLVGWLVFVSAVQQVIRKLTSVQSGSHSQKLIFIKNLLVRKF